MNVHYEITNDFIVRNRPSGRQDYVCHLGETISIGWDNKSNSIIAHGDVTNVARIMQTYENYAKNAADDSSLGSDFVILPLEANAETIAALNDAILNPNKADILKELAQDYDVSRFGFQLGA